MTYINRYFIDDILGSLCGLADSEHDLKSYENVNSNDKIEISKIFQEIIKDEFTVEQKVHDLLHRLVATPAISLFELFKNSKNKNYK